MSLMFAATHSTHLRAPRSTWRRLPADVMASLTALAAGLRPFGCQDVYCDSVRLVGRCRLLLLAASEGM